MKTVPTVSSLVLAAVLVSTSLAAPARAEELGKILGGGQSVDAGVLDTQRGGTSQSINVNTLANVTGNTVGDFSVTGNNSFGGFGQAQGMMNVLQNSGNNVAMQSQLVINVNMQ